MHYNVVSIINKKVLSPFPLFNTFSNAVSTLILHTGVR
nr:MAG TPA: hypothetical protein [Caudoviricetes sp.]